MSVCFFMRLIVVHSRKNASFGLGFVMPAWLSAPGSCERSTLPGATHRPLESIPQLIA